MKLDRSLNVFLGDNGKGKSSVLNAIATVLSCVYPHCDFLADLAAIPYQMDDVRKWSVPPIRTGGRARPMLAETSGIACGLAFEWREGKVVDETKAVALSVGWSRTTGPGFELGSCEKELAELFRCEEKSGAGIPVFAHYGPHRGAVQGEIELGHVENTAYANPFAAYVNSLKPSLDFDAFLDWFNEEEASELREQRQNRDYVSKELQCVREALERVFQSAEVQMSNPRFEPNPKRFVMTSRSSGGECVELLFDQLSDGYRGMVALVADFARRLAIANQYSEKNPLDGDGILMVDEIDAHLHPKWQYRVVSDLQRTFPNVQLIVTTHSAEVVSTVDRKNVYILDTDADGMLQEQHPEQQTEGSFPEDIASEVMEAPNHVQAHPAYRAFQECLYLIQEGRDETPECTAAHNAVLDHYGENHYFTREIQSRIEGMKRRRAMLDRLHRERK